MFELTFGRVASPLGSPDLCSKMCVNSAKKHDKREHSRQEKNP